MVNIFNCLENEWTVKDERTTPYRMVLEASVSTKMKIKKIKIQQTSSF